MGYYVFEGIDGTGKSLQGDLLARVLCHRGAIVRVSEPSNLPTGKLLRQCLRSGEFTEAHAALFLADRMALQRREVVPALEAGRDVISSRSFLSTLVHQQDQWPLGWLLDLHRMLPAKVDRLFILDLDPEEALRRINSRGERVEFYEKLERMQINRQRYLEMAKDPRLLPFLSPNGRVIVIEATGKSPEEVHKEIRDAV